MKATQRIKIGTDEKGVVWVWEIVKDANEGVVTHEIRPKKDGEYL